MQNRLQSQSLSNSDQKNKTEKEYKNKTSIKKIKPKRDTIDSNSYSKSNYKVNEKKKENEGLENFFNKYLKSQSKKEEDQVSRMSVISQDKPKSFRLSLNRKSRRSEIRIFKEKEEQNMQKRRKQKLEQRVEQQKQLKQDIEDRIQDILISLKNDQQKIQKNLDKILDSDIPEQVYKKLKKGQWYKKLENQKHIQNRFQQLIIAIIDEEQKIYRKHPLMKISAFKKQFYHLTDFMKDTLDKNIKCFLLNLILITQDICMKVLFQMKQNKLYQKLNLNKINYVMIVKSIQNLQKKDFQDRLVHQENMNLIQIQNNQNKVLKYKIRMK